MLKTTTSFGTGRCQAGGVSTLGWRRARRLTTRSRLGCDFREGRRQSGIQRTKKPAKTQGLFECPL